MTERQKGSETQLQIRAPWKSKSTETKDEKATRRDDLEGRRRRRETEDRHQDAYRHAKALTNRKRVVRTHRELTRPKGRTPSWGKPEIRPSQKRK